MIKILLPLLIITTYLWGNAAYPYIDGTNSSAPFTHTSVNILHEELLIKPDSDFKNALIEATYTIDVLKDGIKIPLMFYGSRISGKFSVTFDGKPIEIKPLPELFKLPGAYKIDISKDKRSEKQYIFIPSGFYREGITPKDLRYFETDIPAGKHTIKATYQADRWELWNSSVKRYWFAYILSPVKQWRSFGAIDITFDHSQLNSKLKEQCILESNLKQKPTKQTDQLMSWHFKKIPVDVLKLRCTPKIGNTTAIVIGLGIEMSATLLSLPLLLIFLIWIIRRQLKNPIKQFPWIATGFWLLYTAIVFLIQSQLFKMVQNELGEFTGIKYYLHHSPLLKELFFYEFNFFPGIFPHFWSSLLLFIAVFLLYIPRRGGRSIN